MGGCCESKNPQPKMKILSKPILMALGNKGKKYKTTKHNVGQMFLDYVNGRENIEETQLSDYMVSPGRDWYGLKANHLMNRNGRGLKYFIGDYHCMNIQRQLIVVCDHLEYKIGRVELKEGGSPKGHNGLKDVIKTLNGDQNFSRILIGIGRPESREPEDVSEHVLSGFTQDETQELYTKVFPKAYDILKQKVKTLQ